MVVQDYFELSQSLGLEKSPAPSIKSRISVPLYLLYKSISIAFDRTPK